MGINSLKSKYILFILVIISFFRDVNSNNNKIISLEKSSNSSKCQIAICNSDRGTCYWDKCICFQGYTSLKKTKFYCDYKMKNHIIALLLEFFFHFGAGYLYIENYKISGFKCIYFVFLILVFYLFYYFFNGKINDIQKHRLVFLLICYLFCLAIYFLWNIVDWILFLSNILKDGNNIKMI